MRIDERSLTFKALCALHEIAQRAAEAPVEPSFQLRFLLAYLYAVSDAPLWLMKQIWRDLRQADDTNVSGQMAKYTRTTNARIAVEALARHCGMPQAPDASELDIFMNRNGSPEQRMHQLRVDGFREAANEQLAKRKKRRQDRECR